MVVLLKAAKKILKCEHRFTILCLCGVLAFIIISVSVYEQAKLKVKLRAFKTEENEIKTLKIVAIRFCSDRPFF